jgi:hypothetical protein
MGGHAGVEFCTNYVPVKTRAQAGGFGFQKSQARPKATSGLAWLFLAWLGLAWGFRPGPAHHYTRSMIILSYPF